MRPLDLIALSVATVAVNMIVADSLRAQPAPPAPAVTAPAFVEPPPPRQETITVAPSPQTVWVPGAWERTPDTWLWTTGRWVTPPFRRAYWATGYWQHLGGRYQWLPGHWAAGAQGAVVAQKVALPAPLTEVQPAPPTGVNNLVWTPGRWEWRGTWTWIPGHYVESSNPQAVWVPGEWDPAADGAWRWNPAHWAVR
jgi:hypothetical protein